MVRETYTNKSQGWYLVYDLAQSKDQEMLVENGIDD